MAILASPSWSTIARTISIDCGAISTLAGLALAGTLLVVKFTPIVALDRAHFTGWTFPQALALASAGVGLKGAAVPTADLTLVTKLATPTTIAVTLACLMIEESSVLTVELHTLLTE